MSLTSLTSLGSASLGSTSLGSTLLLSLLSATAYSASARSASARSASAGSASLATYSASLAASCCVVIVRVGRRGWQGWQRLLYTLLYIFNLAHLATSDGMSHPLPGLHRGRAKHFVGLCGI